MSLATIDEALKRIRRGEMVLVVDDEDRENEGDLTMAASWVTPEAVNFMLRWGRGLVCMPCDARRLADLDIAPMVSTRRGLAPSARPSAFQRPGHVFPLRARPGGVLERRGHTEASVDLARLAG